MNQQTIDQVFRQQWQTRWLALHMTRFTNDYELAALAHEIRLEFPKGEPGDLQFLQWCRRHLRHGTRAPSFLARAEAFDVFDEHEWKRLGGWPGITFLMSLSRSSRERVVSTLHGDGPFGRGTIRLRALRLGITSPRKGRDTRSRSEARVNTLRTFILRLYRNHPELPELPADVKAAITPTILSTLGSGVRA